MSNVQQGHHLSQANTGRRQAEPLAQGDRRRLVLRVLEGIRDQLNVTDPQFKFLRLLSSKATQRFVYECSSSVGWFDEVSGNHDKAVQLKAHNDDVVSYAPDEQRFTVQDSCATGDKNGRVEIYFDTRDVDILPIKDFRAFDIGDKSKKFGFTIEPVCFHG